LLVKRSPRTQTRVSGRPYPGALRGYRAPRWRAPAVRSGATTAFWS